MIPALIALLAAHTLGGQALLAFLLRRPEFVSGWLIGLRPFICQSQIVLSFSVVAAILHKHYGWRWLGGFAAIYLLCLAAECAGSGWGLIFGRYSFTPLFGPKLFHLVPMLIPFSWFTLAVSSWALASRLFAGRVARIVGGAAMMVAWDLCADPVFVQSSPSWLPRGWVWRDPGPFYGVPWSNYFGWALVSLLLIAALDRFSWARFEGESRRFLNAHFAIHLFAPFGFALVMGLWAAPLMTTLLMSACLFNSQI